MKLYDRIAVDKWRKQLVPCENMKELILVNCIIQPDRGLACVLDKIHLDMCVGLRDNDVVGLSRSSRGLRSIYIRMPSDFSVPLLMSNRLTLTDESLKALAENCPKLDSISISFSDGEFLSLSSFTLNGILYLIRSCPVRELSLDQVCSFNDDGMEALCSAHNLETLELVRCQEITDDGLQLVAQFSRLSVLRLNKCLGVTDDGFKPLWSYWLWKTALRFLTEVFTGRQERCHLSKICLGCTDQMSVARSTSCVPGVLLETERTKYVLADMVHLL